MASITVQITVTRTVAALNATTMDETFQWVKTNVIDKLPPTCTVNISYQATP